MNGGLEHLPEIELRAQRERARFFQQREEPFVLGAVLRQFARDLEVNVRQPANPRFLAIGRLPLRVHAGEVGQKIDFVVAAEVTRRICQA